MRVMVDSFIYFHLDGWCTADALFIYIYCWERYMHTYIVLYQYTIRIPWKTVHNNKRNASFFLNDSSPFLSCCQKNSTRLKCFRCIFFFFLGWFISFSVSMRSNWYIYTKQKWFVYFYCTRIGFHLFRMYSIGNTVFYWFIFYCIRRLGNARL